MPCGSRSGKEAHICRLLHNNTSRAHRAKESKGGVLTIETTKISGNGILKRARLKLSTTLALRRKVLPEQRMVDVTYVRPFNMSTLSEHSESGTTHLRR